MSYGRMEAGAAAVGGRLRRCWRRRARPTRQRTRGCGRAGRRTAGGVAAGKTVGGDPCGEVAVGDSNQRTTRRQPDQDRHPKGGRPYKRGYGEHEKAANFTDPESGIMKTPRGSQATTRRWRWRVSVGGGDGGDGERERRAGCRCCSTGWWRRSASSETVLADAGYSNERDLADLGGIDVCVVGPGGEEGAAPRPGEESRDESHGREAVDAGGPSAYRAQVAVGGSARLDQARAGIPALQPAGAGEVRGEWDLVCLA